MLLFPRRCRYWHLHLHVHTDSHFTFANQHFEHVGPCASLTNHLISLCRHCTFLCHSSSPSLSLHHCHYIPLLASIPSLITPCFPQPSRFHVCPLPRVPSHQTYAQCGTEELVRLTCTTPFPMVLFSRKLLKRSHIPWRFLLKCSLIFEKRNIVCLSNPFRESKWVSGFGFHVLHHWHPWITISLLNTMIKCWELACFEYTANLQHFYEPLPSLKVIHSSFHGFNMLVSTII